MNNVTNIDGTHLQLCRNRCWRGDSSFDFHQVARDELEGLFFSIIAWLLIFYNIVSQIDLDLVSRHILRIFPDEHISGVVVRPTDHSTNDLIVGQTQKWFRSSKCELSCSSLFAACLWVVGWAQPLICRQKGSFVKKKHISHAYHRIFISSA